MVDFCQAQAHFQISNLKIDPKIKVCLGFAALKQTVKCNQRVIWGSGEVIGELGEIHVKFR